MQRLMQDEAGGLTVSCWFKSTSRSANHTLWGMSNQPIPSPLYSTNLAKAVLATLTVEAVTPQRAALGLVRPGDNETLRTEVKLIDGMWHHLAVTIEQDANNGTVTGRLFIDGAPGTKVVIGNQSTRIGTRTVSIEELECYVYVRK